MSTTFRWELSIDSFPPYSDGRPKDNRNQRDFSFVYHHDFFFFQAFFFSLSLSLCLPPTVSIFPEHRKFPWLRVRKRRSTPASLAPVHSRGSGWFFLAEEDHEAVQTWYTTHHRQLGRLLKNTFKKNAPSRKTQLKKEALLIHKRHSELFFLFSKEKRAFGIQSRPLYFERRSSFFSPLARLGI